MDIKKKLSFLKPYTSEQEKNALIKVLDGNFTPIEICSILGGNPSNDLEAEAFIFKMREISVGDIVEVTSTCSFCKRADIYFISIPKMFFNDELKDLGITPGLYENIDEVPEGEIINNKTLEEYNVIEEEILENNKKIFNSITETSCKCGNKSLIKLNYKDIISKFSIKNIFEQYLDISYYTSMTKADTDNMLPFEREIFLGLIQIKEDSEKK